MLHNTKLLMRRLAYAPWLLTIGLVLGWSGVAVANDDSDNTGDTHSHVTDHTHATDPYLEVSYKLVPGTAGTADDSVFVSWSTSYSKNFANNDHCRCSCWKWGGSRQCYVVRFIPGGDSC